MKLSKLKKEYDNLVKQSGLNKSATLENKKRYIKLEKERIKAANLAKNVFRELLGIYENK